MLKKIQDKTEIERAILLTILVASLGYFVDIFDLLLFSIVRVTSLKDLGVPDSALLSNGVFLINVQMAGLLIGGLVWGVWGDRMGRVSVLFGSIFLYSVANIANGFVTEVWQYALLRFIAGLGLAGELGAGVTLASELLPRGLRGLGTTFIATLGVMGAVLAGTIAEITDWRTAYMIGGLIGLGLLLLRMEVKESSLYENVSAAQGQKNRGNPALLLRPALLKKYLAVVLTGAPIWGVIGLFITFTPEFAKDFGMTDIPKTGTAVIFCYIGLSIGDMLSGLLSQFLRSRKKAVMIFLGLTALFTGVYVLMPHTSLPLYYLSCFLLGIGTGYWAMFVQIGAEQFGTNIRATAATSIPNMVRACTIPATASFQALIPVIGVTFSGVTVLCLLLLLAFVAIVSLEETFESDLDYSET